MRRVLVLALGILSCTAEPLRDRPDGMLAPFPADAMGREVPYERMVPYLVEQAVSLAVRPAPVPPGVDRGEGLVDLRNEPVLVLAPGGAFGLSAPWPATKTWTLRPPTRDELHVAPLGGLTARTPAAGWAPVLEWLHAEAARPRPEVQRYTSSVLIVLDGAAPAADARAAASVLTALGAARSVRVAVRGSDGLWRARALPSATLPVPALGEVAAAARRKVATPAQVAGTQESDVQARLARVLAQPIPGPRCFEVEVKAEADVAAKVLAALGPAGPQDVVAVRGIEPSLDLYLHPERLVGDALGPRVRLGDVCE